jgi:hypothetical protein
VGESRWPVHKPEWQGLGLAPARRIPSGRATAHAIGTRIIPISTEYFLYQAAGHQ